MSPGGRPKSDDPHAKVVSVRLTEGEYARAVEAAKASGAKGVGPWMRAELVKATARTLRRKP